MLKCVKVRTGRGNIATRYPLNDELAYEFFECEIANSFLNPLAGSSVEVTYNLNAIKELLEEVNLPRLSEVEPLPVISSQDKGPV